MSEKTYIAIDLKSFYASVECRTRGLDPLDTNLVVADPTRTHKTICLAVTPSLKAFHVPGRPRLFEVVQRVREINAQRLTATGGNFSGKSYIASQLYQNPTLELDYIVAPPRMALYMQYSAEIYNIYLKYIAPEDMHVYSVDEVFMDVTQYLKTYKTTAHHLAETLLQHVYRKTGITATAGIGTNLYLCKIAMDVLAKKIKPDRNGARIAELDEYNYRKKLWNHTPLGDFWQIGKGYEKKLARYGMYTMGDIAKASVAPPTCFRNEQLLYRLFGINTELLIDHAWGYEPCTMQDIKSYRPRNHSLSTGQVLAEPYPYEKTKIVVLEMAENLTMSLLEKRLVTDSITLNLEYDVENLSTSALYCTANIKTDRYGRKMPKPAHGTHKLASPTVSEKAIRNAAEELFCRIANPTFSVRKITLSAENLCSEKQADAQCTYIQTDLFSSAENMDVIKKRERQKLETLLKIKQRYGKNAVLKGTNLLPGATLRQRNQQIGGHNA